jgi:hypothetical protein
MVCKCDMIRRQLGDGTAHTVPAIRAHMVTGRCPRSPAGRLKMNIAIASHHGVRQLLAITQLIGTPLKTPPELLRPPLAIGEQ